MALITTELSQRCRHCELREDAHVGAAKKCLFEATTYWKMGVT